MPQVPSVGCIAITAVPASSIHRLRLLMATRATTMAAATARQIATRVVRQLAEPSVAGPSARGEHAPPQGLWCGADSVRLIALRLESE